MFKIRKAFRDIANWSKKCNNTRTEMRVWTNPDNGVNAISAKTITLDLSDCDEVKVMAQFRRDRVSSGEGACVEVTVPVGRYGSISMRSHDTGTQSESTYLWTRKFRTTTTSISFEQCYLRLSSNATYTSTQPDYLIPLYVNKVKYAKLGGVTQLLKNLSREVIPC